LTINRLLLFNCQRATASRKAQSLPYIWWR